MVEGGRGEGVNWPWSSPSKEGICLKVDGCRDPPLYGKGYGPYPEFAGIKKLHCPAECMHSMK